MPTMDWKKESEGNFPVFPSATYKVKIHSVKRTTAKHKGTPGMQWVASVIEPQEHGGRFISATTWLSESSLWRVAMLVEACGLNGMPVVDTDSQVFMDACLACVGRTTYWRNEQGSFEGKLKNDIVDFQPDPEESVIEFSVDGDAPDFAKG